MRILITGGMGSVSSTNELSKKEVLGNEYFRTESARAMKKTPHNILTE